MKTITGTVRYHDDLGQTWEARSYLDPDTGEVTTEAVAICESTGIPCGAAGLDGLPDDCPLRDGQPCPVGVVPAKDPQQ